jgi:hypothetical protein
LICKLWQHDILNKEMREKITSFCLQISSGSKIEYQESRRGGGVYNKIASYSRVQKNTSQKVLGFLNKTKNVIKISPFSCIEYE